MLHKLNLLPLLVIPVLSAAYVLREDIVELPWTAPPRTAETLPPVRTFEIQSEHTGVTYQIFVQVPHEYDTTGPRYPVFYTLQAPPMGNAYDEMIAPLLRRRQIPDIVFVAITRPRPQLLNRDVWLQARRGMRGQRSWADDLTFYKDPIEQNGGGGADAFIEFLEKELMPRIDTEFHTDPGDRGIGGADLGGSFAVEISYRRPGMFKRAVAITPRVAFADYGMIDGIRSLEIRPRRRSTTRLYLGIGAMNYPSVLSDFELLCSALNQIDTRSVRLKTEILRGRDRENEIFPAGRAGLRFVYGD